MIPKVSSQRELIEDGQLNEESQINSLIETDSIKTTSNRSERESSIGKGRPITRRPDNHRSNFEAYKQIKRKSQQKQPNTIIHAKMEQPPRYPRSSQELKLEPSATPITGPSEEQSLLSSVASPSNRGDSAVRFKKKALSKQQIIEIKDYMTSLELDKLQTNSVATSERVPKDHRNEQSPKQPNKKSKTQYFHPEEIQGRRTHQHQIPSNTSESQLELASLREKCQSVDCANTVLQKQMKWLREEVQMHLERQQEARKVRQRLEGQLKEKQRLLNYQKQLNQKMSKQLANRATELNKMRELIVELNIRYDNDREILISEIEYLKSEKESELEAQQKAYEERIHQLEQSLEGFRQERQECQQQETKEGEQYFTRMIEKLVAENKYLKMENHMLARCKEDMLNLKNENKKIANERDTLKKKLIENAKKEVMRMRMMDDSDDSSMKSLSQLSYSLSHLRP